MYRNTSYSSKDKAVILYTWDENGNRVTKIEPFRPYLYIETGDNTKYDATSIFGTKLLKKTFDTDYDRRKWVENSGMTRIFHNLPVTQQYLLDKHWKDNEKPEFVANPLKYCFLDIEVYAPGDFPAPERADEVVDLITVWNSSVKRFTTWGLKPLNEWKPEPDTDYIHCSSETKLLNLFVDHIETERYDVLSGWNCITHNQHVWLNDRICKISQLSNLSETPHLKKLQYGINKIMHTGKKREFIIKNSFGNIVRCSKDHKFMVYKKRREQYKNLNTLTKELCEVTVEDMMSGTNVYDYYTVSHISNNNNCDYTYRQFIIENVEKLLQSPFISLWSFDKPLLTPHDVLDAVNSNTLHTTRRNTSKHKRFIDVNCAIESELLQFCGYIFTDGTYNAADNTVRWTACESDIVSKYADIINRYNVTLHTVSNTPIHTTYHSDEKEYHSYNKQIAATHKAGILLSLIYNTNAKKQPDIEHISRLSKEQFYALFAGMIDGDGCVQDTHITLCNYDCVKYNFLHDIAQLIQWNGGIARVFDNYVQLSACVQLNHEFITRVRKYMHHTKRRNLIDKLAWYDKKNTASNKIEWMWRGDTNDCIVKLESITDTGNDVEMWDIETEGHHFLCNGTLVHNCESFDIPYLVNRITKKLGEDVARRLSPTGRIRATEFVNRFGKTVQKWTFDGVSCLDYLELYRKFTFSESESYKLNAIAYKELGATKTDYGDMTLVELSDNFWDKYVEYNIQDVRLIVQLDQKLEFIALMRMLAAFGLCEMQAALGTVSVVNGAAAIESFKRGQIIPTFVIDEGAQIKIPGAYVAEPKQGFATHVMSFDANSLYPSVMISLNLSPETKFGKILSEENGIKTIQTVTGKRYTVDEEQFKELLVKGNLTLTKANILFSKKTQGIIPKLLDYYYKQRVQAKNSMKNCKKKVAKIDEAVKTGVITAEQGAKKRHEYDFEAQRLHLLQLTIKIFLNSVYGYMVNKFSACGDPEIGASVTLTGQTVVKAAAEFGFDYIESQINRKMSSKERDDCWTYSDTDSVYLTFNKLFKENNLQYTTKDGKASKDAYRVAQECEDYINAAITKFAEAEFNTSDSRFMFKRESIADGGIFLQKKRYILHSLDDEGVPCDKYKYVGVEVNRTATPKPVKDCIKHITETMIKTQSKVEADKVLQSVYEKFQTLDVDEIAITSNIKDIAKYNLNTGDLKTPKGCPWHVKAAHNHNYIVRKLNISHKYADIVNGDKIRIVRLRTPNAYDIKNIAYTSNGYPKEFANILKPDVEELFDRLIFSVVERMYDAVKWTAQKPSEALKYSAEDLFI